MANTIDDKLQELEQEAATPKEDHEAERLHRKQRLAAGLRTMGRLHLAEGVAGHVTVRDPEFPDRFWVNPFGKNFKLMTVSDLICVDHSGEIVEGDGALNQAAFAIHGQIHQARPDIMAAAHSHSMYGKTFSTLGKPLKMITQDSHDVLQRRRAVQRRQWRRRARHRGRPQDGRGTRRPQGADPPEPRSDHDRRFGRRRGVVVHRARSAAASRS